MLAISATHDFQRRLWRQVGTEASLFLAILVVIGMTAFLDDSYRVKPAYNAQELIRLTSILGIYALGAATVIIAGGIDLSSGAVVAVSATTCTSVIYLLVPQAAGEPDTSQIPLWILCAACSSSIFLALLIGTFHTWLITSVGLPPFVATLASLVGLRSLARLLIKDVTRIAEGREEGNTQIYIIDNHYHQWGTVWWIPAAVFLVLCFFLWVLLARTVVGRHIYAMGGNEQAARLSGIRTENLKWLAYCIGTVTAAIAGILHSSYISMAEPVNDGMGWELNAIAASVVGGCSLNGGSGSIGGVMLGALFLQVVIDFVAKVFDQYPDILQGLIVGILVIFAVAFNQLRSMGGLRTRFFQGRLGWVNVPILGLLSSVVIMVISGGERRFVHGLIGGTLVFLLMFGMACLERARDRKPG